MAHVLFPSGDSKPGQHRSERQSADDRHGFQGICKFRPAVTAHLICLAFQREHTAEVNVVTPKEEIKHIQKEIHRPRSQRMAAYFPTVVPLEG